MASPLAKKMGAGDLKYYLIIRGSSSGRTPGFGPGNRGSNPCPRAISLDTNLLFSGKFKLSWLLNETEAPLA